MMRLLSCLLLLCVVGVSARPVVRSHIVKTVNNAKTTWTAHMDKRFQDWDVVAFQRLLGAKTGSVNASLPVRYHDVDVRDLPSQFDSRQKWPSCIGPVLNQGSCGSCWAFGAVESISDRMCIEKNSSFVQLSALDMVTCDDGWFGGNGCFGGEPSQAWDWAKSNGLVSESCRPYLESEGGPVKTCPPAQQPCTNFQQTPSCVKQCKNGASYENNKHYIRAAYGLSPDQTSWMSELVKNGPFESSFTVYEDFVHYKSGVYQHTTGKALGGHAIKVIGYGTDSGVPYWLVQNSWTTQWGDKGYFKILRGSDECGIENGGVAGNF